MNEQTSQGPPAGSTPSASSPSPARANPKETAGRIKDSIRETGEKAKARAGQVTGEAKDRGQAYLQEKKTRTADRIEGYGESMRQTAERFEEERDPNIAHYTRLAADKLEQAAAYVRDRDFRQLQRDAEDLARRHPAVFFGGMFVAGLAAARFIKASSEATRVESTSEEISDTANRREEPVAGAEVHPAQPIGIP